MGKSRLGQKTAASSLYVKERKYWLNQLSGELIKSRFPYDFQENQVETGQQPAVLEFALSSRLTTQLLKLGNRSDPRLLMILITGLVALLEKYMDNGDIIIGTTIYKQAVEGDFINTILPLRNRVEHNCTFKQLLLQVRETLVEACENQNYPLEILLYHLNMEFSRDDFPLFDIAVLLENIQDRQYIREINPRVLFSFLRTGNNIRGVLQYDPSRYRHHTMENLLDYFMRLLEAALEDVNSNIAGIMILSEAERKKLLIEFNRTGQEYPADKTVVQLFEDQVKQNRDKTAVVWEENQNQVRDRNHLTFKELDARANGLAGILRDKGLRPDRLVGLMVEPSGWVPPGIMGILKAGGAYLPVDPEVPKGRIETMLNDCDPGFLLTTRSQLNRHSFTSLQHLHGEHTRVHINSSRPPISNLDSLPFPDRGLIDYEKYNHCIGQALVKNSISLQATRGCPYKCAYCHKIWPGKHVFRSAKNIFEEVLLYYRMGVRRFSFIDDIFNLDNQNSRRFFEMIIKNKLKVHLFFPNGMRGDLLTRDYIDLMVEAGLVDVALALETASPRLQALIGKRLQIDKLRENIDYFCRKYPQVILELFTMHGFPSESEEEALITLEFIKSIKWAHFPYVNILKIYHNTEMEKLALREGISRQAILRSENLAHHQLPETLPFDKQFTVKYQADFLNEYFLLEERLLHVLPFQMRILSENEIVQKYNSYLPAPISSFDDLSGFFEIKAGKLGNIECLDESEVAIENFNQKLKLGRHFPAGEPDRDALRVLLLDLSQLFSSDSDMLYDVVEPPLGLLYVMTYLKQQLGSRIKGKIAKSRIDFDSYAQLRFLLEEFQPEVIGIRTLIVFKDFFHQVITMIRGWGIKVPIIAGGPYATSSYDLVLQDRNIDLAVLGEGEVTFTRLIKEIIDNNGKLPPFDILKDIPGMAFVPDGHSPGKRFARELILMDQLGGDSRPIPRVNHPGDLVYAIFTSGSTGKPKSMGLSHRNLVNYFSWFSEKAQLHPEDRTVLISSFAFDLGYTSLYPSLLGGLELHILPRELYLSPRYLSDYLEQNQVSYIKLTPSFFGLLMNHPDFSLQECGWLRLVVLGGEVMGLAEVERAHALNNQLAIMNHYGPTEATIGCVAHMIDFHGFNEYKKRPFIGKPIHNTAVYIMGRRLSLMPPGVAGELCIAGDCLGRGYLNNPGLTQIKFFHGFQGFPGCKRQRIYRTGDMARWLGDGNIEFLGRIDQQVKIRGYRIELGEIENRLPGYPGIKEAAVLARQGADGDRYLCAYIVPDGMSRGNFDLFQLKDYLTRQLPDYMIPGYIVPIEKIPLTPNGKIDLKALPEPGPAGETNYSAPVSFLEKKLAEIWSRLLFGESKEKQASLSIHSNFFELGGHSLKAIMLISQIQKELNIKLPLAEIFKRPTIKELTGYIEEKLAWGDRYTYVSIAPVEKKQYYELSSAQLRLYMLQQLDLSSTGYNKPYFMHIEGKLEEDKLADVFAQLIQRHESLRTSFFLVGDDPVQRVHDEVFSGHILTSYGEEGGEAAKTLKNFIGPFDLSVAPLLRIGLIRQEEEKYLLMMDMHHIIADGTSMGIFITDFVRFYEGKNQLPLRLQYKDYSLWQKQEKERGVIKEHREYWLKQFAGGLPVLDLPFDYTRPVVQGFDGDSIRFEVGRRETGQLKDLAAGTNTTLYMLVLAAYYVFLSKLSGQADIIMGMPVVGRGHADLSDIIGMFVNTLAIRKRIEPGKTFNRFLKELNQQVLGALDHQDYQFRDLVESAAGQRQPGRNPIFDVMFVFQDVEIPAINIPGLKFRPCEFEGKISKFDLTLQGAEEAEMLFFSFEYCTKLFKSRTMRRFAGYFQEILSVVADNPDRLILDIEMIPKEERERILLEFNDTCSAYPEDKTLHGLFLEQVERTPDYSALIGMDTSRGYHQEMQITYRELSDKSDGLAYLLNKRGVAGDSIIGLKLEPSLEMIIGILGILKAGGGYLPIDPGYPGERIRYMLKDSGAKMLITTGSLAKEVKEDFGVIFIDTFDFSVFSSSHLLNFSTSHSTGLAYIIYTSGTTGRPKGVIIEHGQVVNTILSRQAEYQMDSAVVSLQLFSFAFDGFLTSFFTPVISGAKQVILPGESYKDITGIKAAILEHWVTHFICVPPMFRAIIETLIPSEAVSLKTVTLAGDAISPDLLQMAMTLNPGLEIVNEYGVTEAAVMSTIYRNQQKAKTILIGRPIKNTYIHIINSQVRLQGIGIPGELCISGAGVSIGYLNNPELTNKKFLPGGPGGAVFIKRVPPGRRRRKIYRTGDLAKWLEDGNIHFLGRIDNQVKIRGFRIELGEIESCLLLHKEIRQAAVVPVSNYREQANDDLLCAYIVSDRKLSIEGLREHLSRSLPGYMLPSYFEFIGSIPLTASGKVDRQALPEPGFKAAGEVTVPGDEIERELIDTWTELLVRTPGKIGIDDNFFQCGGHSLAAMRMCTRIQEKFNIKVQLAEIFKHATIRELARVLRRMTGNRYILIGSAEKREYYPLSSSQRRMYVVQQMALESTGYNLPTAVLIEGNPDIDKLEQVFKRIIRRHNSLRTCFMMKEGKPVQRVCDEVKFEIGSHEAAGGIESIIRPFELSRSPLLRVGLIRQEEGVHLMIVDMHHIISDGVSQGILLNEFMELYGGGVLVRLEIDYQDYALWQRGDGGKQIIEPQKAYWQQTFAGDIPVLELPTDYSRPIIKSNEGSQVKFEISREKLHSLKRLALQENVTFFMLLLSLFSLLLSKLSGQEDMVIGTPTAGRRYPGLNRVVGFFVNTLALRSYPRGSQRFRTFLKETKENVLAAFENQDYPFEELVEGISLPRDVGRHPLFDVMLVFQDLETPGIHLPGLTFKPYEITRRISRFDLTLGAVETGENMRFVFEYSTRLFTGAAIQRFTGYFSAIISAILDNVEQKLSDIEIITENERRQVLVEFNRTAGEYPRHMRLDEIFAGEAKKTPGSMALIGSRQDAAGIIHITYGQLNRETDQLAYMLREQGVQPEMIVGIMAERSVEIIMGILGILKAGGAYLPIDVEYPEERINFMLADSGARMLVTPGKLAEVGSIQSDIQSNSVFKRGNPAGQLAYVIYTSGSTGRPKGTMVNHYSAVNLVCSQVRRYKTDKTERVLQFSSLCFDASVEQIFISFFSGAGLVLIDKNILLDSHWFEEYIMRQGITHLNAVPSFFNNINLKTGVFKTLRRVVSGGDRCTLDLYKKLRACIPHTCVIFNCYGPTEGTVTATEMQIREPDETLDTIPIGQPIGNIIVHLLDRWMRLVPLGVAGEIHITGEGIARGYMNHPQLTTEKFTDIKIKSAPGTNQYARFGNHPNKKFCGGPGGGFSKEPPGRRRQKYFKTGDLGKRMGSGSILFLGRVDYQVKIRGIRIEIEEVERQLLKHEKIKAAVVTLREDGAGNRYLCAYIHPVNPSYAGMFTQMVLREFLLKLLPGYMIPAYFVCLDRIPLTGGGKPDRKALPLPEAAAISPGTSYEAPKSETESLIAAIWREVLRVDKVGVHDNFFAIGGNSLQVIQVTEQLKEKFGRTIPVVTLFRYPTIRSLVEYLQKEGGDMPLSGDRGDELEKGKARRKQLRRKKKNRETGETGDSQ